MKHKNSKLIVLLLLGFISVRAQQAIFTTGGEAVGVGGNASYSIGQVAYTSISTSGNVNQGVQQPYEFMALGIDNIKDAHLFYSVYPNPAVSTIYLKVDNKNLENLSFELYDISGKLLLKQKVNTDETPIAMENLTPAIYFLKLIDNNQEVKTFKIIKN